MVEQRVEKYEIHSYYKNQNESKTKKKIFNFWASKNWQSWEYPYGINESGPTLNQKTLTHRLL